MLSLSMLKHGRGVLLALLLGLFGFAWAVGPVPVTGLPGGGVELSDSDTGNGQAWGRGSGRNIVYRMTNQAQYSALTFGVVGGTSPSLTFDGSAGGALAFNNSQSSLPGGVAVFTGNAGLFVWNGSGFVGISVPTRFVMTLTRVSTGTPVALQFDGVSGVNPGGNVLNVGDIRVNLLFQMQDMTFWGGSGAFVPVLDRYDSLPTPPGAPPGNPGPVMTGVSTGFYYTMAVGGMKIEQHDQHLTAEMNIVKSDLGTLKTKVGFMHDDWVPRWSGIQGQVQGVQTSLNNDIKPSLDQIKSQVQQLLGQGGGTGNLATRDDVNNAKNSLNEILMIMLGFAPCPADKAPPGFCDNFGNLKKLGGDTTQILAGLNNLPSLDGILIGLNNALQAKLAPLQNQIDELQVTLDNMASQSLDVQAIQVDSGDPKKLRWLVKTTRDGVMVNASLTRLATVRGSTLANVTPAVSNLGTGLHDVTLGVTKDTEGIAYLFEAALSAGGATIHGTALLITEKKGASPF